MTYFNLKFNFSNILNDLGSIVLTLPTEAQNYIYSLPDEEELSDAQRYEVLALANRFLIPSRYDNRNGNRK